MTILFLNHLLMNKSLKFPPILYPKTFEIIFQIINSLFFLFFSYLKYIFAFILILLGTLILLKFRGIHRHDRLINDSEDSRNDWKVNLTKSHIMTGTLYIFMGFGIMFNFLTYILIWLLEPLPDRLVFEFIAASWIFDSEYIYCLSDINSTLNSYEQTLYFSLALISFISILQIVLCIWFIIKEGNIIKNPIKIFSILMSGIVEGIFAGFTTSLFFFI